MSKQPISLKSKHIGGLWPRPKPKTINKPENNRENLLKAKAGELQSLTTTAATIGLIAFVTTAVFEYAYLKGLGLTPNVVPLSIADFSLRIFNWIQIFAACAIANFVWTNWPRKKKLENSVRGENGKKESDFSFYSFILIITLLGVISYIALGDMAHFGIVAIATFIVVAFAGIYLKMNLFSDYIGDTTKAVIILTISFLGLLYGIAFESARFEASAPPVDTIYLSNNGIIHARVLRSYTGGYLLMKGKATYIPAGKVEKIEYGRREYERVGIPCMLFDIWCPPIKLAKSP